MSSGRSSKRKRKRRAGLNPARSAELREAVTQVATHRLSNGRDLEALMARSRQIGRSTRYADLDAELRGWGWDRHWFFPTEINAWIDRSRDDVMRLARRVAPNGKLRWRTVKRRAKIPPKCTLRADGTYAKT